MNYAAADAIRRNKERWLVHPIDLAGCSSFFGGFMGLLMWLTGIEVGYVLTIAIGSNIVSAGLLLWGTRRIINAARGRY